MIVAVDKTNLFQAAIIHSVSWKESHSSFCAPVFVEMHTPERQQGYIQNKMNCGSKFFLLIKEEPIGIVSVKTGETRWCKAKGSVKSASYHQPFAPFYIPRCS